MQIHLLFFALFLSIANIANGQVDTTKTTSKLYIITTNTGGEFIGKIISHDAKEILIETQDRGQVFIPKFEIKEIKELETGELSTSGGYIPEQIFAT